MGNGGRSDHAVGLHPVQAFLFVCYHQVLFDPHVVARRQAWQQRVADRRQQLGREIAPKTAAFRGTDPSPETDNPRHWRGGVRNGRRCRRRCTAADASSGRRCELGARPGRTAWRRRFPAARIEPRLLAKRDDLQRDIPGVPGLLVECLLALVCPIPLHAQRLGRYE